MPMEEVDKRAIELSIKFDHARYDGFYLALAEREQVPFMRRPYLSHMSWRNSEFDFLGDYCLYYKLKRKTCFPHK